MTRTIGSLRSHGITTKLKSDRGQTLGNITNDQLREINMTDEEFEERRCLLKMLGYSVVKDECLGFLFYVPEHPVPSTAQSTPSPAQERPVSSTGQSTPSPAPERPVSSTGQSTPSPAPERPVPSTSQSTPSPAPERPVPSTEQPTPSAAPERPAMPSPSAPKDIRPQVTPDSQTRRGMG